MMSIKIPRVVSGAGRHTIGRVASVAAASAVLAPSAGAAVSGTATLAPIGTGNYLLIVQNTGDSEVRSLTASGSGEGFKNFDPSGCIALGGGFGCAVTIAPGASMQLCYSGPAVTGVTLEVNLAHVPVTTAPTVASCPLPGFTPVSDPVTQPGSTAGGGGSTAAGPAFSLGKAKDDTHKGTATLVVNLPGSGKLVLSGKVKVKVSVTFTPTGGTPTTQTKSVKLVKQVGK